MGARILLVDDEASIVMMVKRRLESVGYEVLWAKDGEEALALAAASRPDLVILDIMLPKKNGYEVCRLLRASEAQRHLPVLMLSAKTQVQDEAAGLAAGANAYLRKPFRTQELLDHVSRLLAA